MFDTRQYEFADLTLILGGRDLTGFRGVKYNEKIEREPLYAKGRQPHSVQSGNVAYEGELVLLQSEFEALVLAGGGSILNLKGLVANLCYGDPSTGDVMLTDSIEGIYFTESPKELKQGDKFMEVTLPFIALRVNRQVA